MSQLSRQFGITLIELMITISVLVILITLAVPAFNLAEQRRLVGAAESALDQIQTARSEAIKQGRDIWFVSQTDGDDWCHGISQTAGCDCFEPAGAGDACEITIAGEEDPILRTTVSSDYRNINMTGDQELRFDHVRSMVSGSRETIAFTSSPNSFQMEVQINPIGRPSACGTNRTMGAYPAC
ncbi:putative type IV pilin [Thioalkalivibrio sp. K90mix]|uniref:GspH/FimT family pseudopilin n=1 Tax=Thioalkalivibrio sp. (strain K90mix) TaxID=396595 RepID=UPI000195A382|nr:GspH/FimT family pseudopilin [Thioalkalivibrio sp. K90mix]ADC70734.1 putative type IV pilin [Thioalkalivibrio sp. K90mix]